MQDTHISESADVARFDAFVARWERFTSLLACAAQYGCSPRRKAEYAETRTWILTNYPPVRSRLQPHFSRRFVGSALLESDPVQQTFQVDRLDDLLATDTGELIFRVTLISEAVYDCFVEVRGEWV